MSETGSNVPEYRVAEIAGAVKRVVEDNFGYVRVRGEVSGFKKHGSGHCYFALKDEEAVLDAVCWKGVAAKLNFQCEDGLEVIASGRVTTYPGRSKYQLVVTEMVPAGAGALMALLEKRRQMLTAEGLFEASRKKKLPFLPQVIGVVTSPTGAVIRDILHRIADRFPVRVLVWPVAVQGEGAAEQVAAAVRGFNACAPESGMRPDLVIVARGGGSLEDLWAFNEEVVVRAVAESAIPLISAVGHETDTTLIDFASDVRAPTPTAAAEMAVPVLAEWLLALRDHGQRMGRSMQQRVGQSEVRLQGLARGLPRPQQMLEGATQRLDDWTERLGQAWGGYAARQQHRLAEVGRGLTHPQHRMVLAEQKWLELGAQLGRALLQALERKAHRVALTGGRMPSAGLKREVERQAEAVNRLWAVGQESMPRRVRQLQERVENWGQRLEAVSYTNTLKRGFVLVRDAEGRHVAQASQLAEGMGLMLEFQDGVQCVVAGEQAVPRAVKPVSKKKLVVADDQSSLF